MSKYALALIAVIGFTGCTKTDRAEMRVALDFLRRPETPGMTRWEQYAQMLLALNEMLYVD